MDAQTQIVAELYKTLNDAQKQEVCNMIDTLLSQQLNDQQSLDSHSAATENQDKVVYKRHNFFLSAVFPAVYLQLLLKFERKLRSKMSVIN